MSEEKKESQAKKMYGNSPKLERDEKSGDMAVKRKEKPEEKAEGEDQGSASGGVPVTARHSMERMELHSKHEREHMMHDHGKHGDKKELHERHEEEFKAIHAKHEKELGKEKE